MSANDNPIRSTTAAREGFEPSEQETPLVSLANWWNKPLSHLAKADFLLRGAYPHQRMLEVFSFGDPSFVVLLLTLKVSNLPGDKVYHTSSCSSIKVKERRE